jgi:hypothetical protein
MQMGQPNDSNFEGFHGHNNAPWQSILQDRLYVTTIGKMVRHISVFPH